MSIHDDLIAQDEAVPVRFGNLRPADQDAAGGRGEGRDVRRTAGRNCSVRETGYQNFGRIPETPQIITWSTLTGFSSPSPDRQAPGSGPDPVYGPNFDLVFHPFFQILDGELSLQAVWDDVGQDFGVTADPSVLHLVPH